MEGLHAEHAKLLAMSLVSPLQQRECLGTPGSNVEKEMTPKAKMATPTDKCVEHSERWDAQTSSQISAHPKYPAPAPDRVPVSRENELYFVPHRLRLPYFTPICSGTENCRHCVKAIFQAEHFKPEQEPL